MRKKLLTVVALGLSMVGYSATWQASDVLNRLEVKGEIPALTDNLAGENIDSSSGELSFFHTDIDFSGNSAIPMKTR